VRRPSNVAVRKRIIKAVPRSLLENCSSNDERPWSLDRHTLEERVLARWDDAIKEEFLGWLGRAS